MRKAKLRNNIHLNMYLLPCMFSNISLLNSLFTNLCICPYIESGVGCIDLFIGSYICGLYIGASIGSDTCLFICGCIDPSNNNGNKTNNVNKSFEWDTVIVRPVNVLTKFLIANMWNYRCCYSRLWNVRMSVDMLLQICFGDGSKLVSITVEWVE